MRLSLCSRCERHVDPDERRCPFCNARLGTVTARDIAPAWLMAAGLAMAGCAPEKSAGTDDPSCDADEGDTCTADSGVATTEDNSDSGGEEYAGEGGYTESDGYTEEYGGEEYAGGGEYTDTDDYGTDTGTGTTDTGTGDTGTDTDTDTTEPPGGTEDSGGEDYAGPAPGSDRS